MILEYQPAFLGPSSLQGCIPWYTMRQISEKAKICFPEVQGSELSVHLPCCPKDLKLHFVVLAREAALKLHIPCQPLLVGRKRSSTAPPLLGASVTWRRKLQSMHSRRLLDCLCAAVLTDIRVIEDPHEEQGLCTRGFSSLSVRGLIFSVFLVTQSLADPLACL